MHRIHLFSHTPLHCRTSNGRITIGNQFAAECRAACRYRGREHSANVPATKPDPEGVGMSGQLYSHRDLRCPSAERHRAASAQPTASEPIANAGFSTLPAAWLIKRRWRASGNRPNAHSLQVTLRHGHTPASRLRHACLCQRGL